MLRDDLVRSAVTRSAPFTLQTSPVRPGLQSYALILLANLLDAITPANCSLTPISNKRRRNFSGESMSDSVPRGPFPVNDSDGRWRSSATDD